MRRNRTKEGRRVIEQKRKSPLLAWLLAPTLFFVSGHHAVALDAAEADYELKLLGKYIFFDKISEPKRMACVTCHDPATGGTGSVAGVNLRQVVITGANPHTVGNLKPPTNAYASRIKPFQACDEGINTAPASGGFCGGNFWDGRAEGRGPADGGALFPAGATKHIGDEVFQGLTDPPLHYAAYFGPTADQALNPMPNPDEQNIGRQAVCEHVASAKYAELYLLAWGEAIDCRDVPVAISAPDVEVPPEKAFDISFKRLMLAVGAWQHSGEVNSFSSRRDRALRAELACVEGASDADPAVCNHPDFINSPGKFPLVGLTAQENLGHALFYNIRFNPRFDGLPAANCGFCHSENPASDDGTELLQLYADHAYHNIGTPPNPELPAAPAPGLGGHTGAPPGFFRTPTLRNVDKRKDEDFTKAYTHNGWFKSLESIIHFYNTAAVKPRCPDGVTTEKEALKNGCWPEPEHPGAPIPALIGNLGMSAEEEAAVVAYLKTFTDDVTPTAPPPYKPARKK